MPKFARTMLLSVAIARPSMQSSPAEAQSSPTYVNVVELDIVPAKHERYIEAIRENGAASVKEPGCRWFDITVTASDPNHFLLYEVYDNEAAYKAHRETDHFKKYAAAATNMVAKRYARQMTPIAFNSKGH